MENKIGDLVRVPLENQTNNPYQHRYVWIKIKEAETKGWYGQCRHCFYRGLCGRYFNKNYVLPLLGTCTATERSDNKPIYFVKDHYGTE